MHHQNVCWPKLIDSALIARYIGPRWPFERSLLPTDRRVAGSSVLTVLFIHQHTSTTVHPQLARVPDSDCAMPPHSPRCDRLRTQHNGAKRLWPSPADGALRSHSTTAVRTPLENQRRQYPHLIQSLESTISSDELNNVNYVRY